MMFAIAAIASGIGSIMSSRSASKAAKANLAFQKEAYNYQKQEYEWGRNNIMEQFGHFDQTFNDALAAVSAGMGHRAGAAHATAYDAEAFDAEAVLANLEEFIQKMDEALGENAHAMETFTRRYGPIMDNVAEGIMKTSQERLSASGREQLALDRDTIMSQLDQKLANQGLTRSGIKVELQQRMDMDFAKQARKIDVDSYAQSNALQAQGTQTLNSMYGIGENIRVRREGLLGAQAEGIRAGEMLNAQLATNVNLANANNQTQVSLANANNKTRVSMANAAADTQVSIANAQMANQQGAVIGGMFNSIAQQRFAGGMNAFARPGIPGTGGVSNAYGNVQQQAQGDANGYAAMAGKLGKMAGWF